MKKICTKCKEDKEISEFWNDSDKSDGKSTRCKPCATRPGRKQDPGYHRRYRLKTKYGLTEEQYADILAKQNNCCWVCGKTSEKNRLPLAVDHSHRTGLIRGLLCTYCNHRLVGKHEEPALLRKIADYLEQSTGLVVPFAQIKPKRRRSVKRKPTKAADA